MSLHRIERQIAKPYFLSAIDADGSNLSSRIDPILTAGSFFAIAPEEITDHQLYDFRRGGVVPARATAVIKGHPSKQIEPLAVELGDVTIASSVERANAFIREPYLKQGDQSSIARSLRSIESVPFKVMPLENCSSLSLANQIKKFQVPWSFLLIASTAEEHESVLGAIISNAFLIAVGAYDGESYLCWVRSDVVGRILS